MSDREDFEKWLQQEPESVQRLYRALTRSGDLQRSVAFRAFLAGRKPPEGKRLVPTAVFDALVKWTGSEPSQSILARELEEWGGPSDEEEDAAAPERE